MKHLVFFLLALSVVSAFVPANHTVSSISDIERRILRAITFVENHYQNGRAVSGYLHDENSSVARAYAEDNALVVLALSAYQESHFSSSYYADLQKAMEFVVAAQTTDGDFYGYYDFGDEAWNFGGKFYYWNAVVLMSIAYAAFTITNQISSERAFWLPIVNKLRLCIDNWLPSSLSESGGVEFAFPDGSRRTDVTYQGALLMGLMHLTAFEYYWGQRNVADRFVDYATRMANWLYPLQERDSSRWGFGGFYSNVSMSLQTSEENAFAMFWLNRYYKVVGLLIPTDRTELEGMRTRMQDWEEGYVENITDNYGGVSFGRDAHGPTTYPRRTWTVSATLAATVDVWINLGPAKYWNDSSRIYAWLTGSNGRSPDMQTPRGNFYEGIFQGTTLHASDLASTMLALYSIIRAAFVSIPGTYPVTFTNPKFTRTISSTSIVVSQSTNSTIHDTTAPPENLVLYAIVGLVAVGIAVGLFTFKWNARKKHKGSAISRPAHSRKR